MNALAEMAKRGPLMVWQSTSGADGYLTQGAYDIAQAALQDEANRHARKGGRKAWGRDDYKMTPREVAS